MEIATIRRDRINPAPYNPRLDLKPGDEAYEQLARSVDEFGYVEPLVWNKRTGHLVGGHQRFKILLARGASEVAVSVVDLDPVREKALNLALNKIQGDWDDAKLARLLDDLLQEDDLEFGLTGFDFGEARDLIAQVLGEDSADNPDAFDPESLAPAGAEPVTQPGDLIRLGTSADPHLLLCGDSTDAAGVERLVAEGGGRRASLFATDPPYMVGYRGSGGRSRGRRRVPGAEDDWDPKAEEPALYRGFIDAAVRHAITDDAAWYCWHASRHQALLERVWGEFDVRVHCQIIWAKNRATPGRSVYMWRHEPCLFGWRSGQRPKARGDKLTTVWDLDTIPPGPERPDHPTPKPIALFEIPMRRHTRPGGVCYEPFAGSGSQIIAAERLGRRCLAIERSPRYCDLIVRRYIEQFGAAAVDPGLAERYAMPAMVEAGAAAGGVTSGRVKP